MYFLFILIKKYVFTSWKVYEFNWPKGCDVIIYSSFRIGWNDEEFCKKEYANIISLKEQEDSLL